MPRVVEGSHATSDHAEPSMGVDVEGPGGGRAAAAGECVAAIVRRGYSTLLGGLLPPCYHAVTFVNQ